MLIWGTRWLHNEEYDQGLKKKKKRNFINPRAQFIKTYKNPKRVFSNNSGKK